MIRKKLLVSNILVFAFIVVAIYFMQNLVFFDTTNFYRSFTFNEYILIFGLLLIVLGVTLYYEYKRLNRRPNWFFFFVCAIAFVCHTVGVLLLPYEATSYDIVSTSGELYTFVIDVTMEERIYSILSGFAMVCVTYFVFAILPHRMYYRKQLMFAFVCILFIGFALALYSWITEWDKYMDTFRAFVGESITIFHHPRSLFINRNNFAFVLFICIVSCLYLNIQKPRFYWYVIATLFYINAFLTLCKTIIILAPIVLIAYLIFRFFLTFKAHRVRNIVAGIILFVVFGSFTIISLISVYGNIEQLSPLTFFYEDIVIGIGKTSMKSRFNIWTYTISILFNLNYIFGIGIDGIEPLLKSLTYTETGSVVMRNSWFTHNGILQTLSYGGIILFVLTTIVVIYLIYVIIKTYRHDKELVSFTIIMMFAVLAYMMVESMEIVFVTSMEYLTVMMIVVVPLLARYYQAYKPHHMREIAYINANSNRFDSVPKPSLFKSRTFLSLFVIVSSSILGVLIYCARALSYNLIVAIVIIGLLILLAVFALPFIFHKLSQKRRKTSISYQELLLEIIIPNLALMFISFFISTIFSYAFGANNSALQILIPIVVTVSLVLLICINIPISTLFGYEYILDHINDLYIKVFAKEISKDELYEPIETTRKDDVVFVYSSKHTEFTNKVISALPNKTVYLITNDLKLTRYEKIQLSRYHKVVTPHTLMKMEDILSDSFNYNLSSFIVIGGDIIDKKFLRELKEVHPNISLTYLAYKKNYQSSSYLKIFDKAYLVDEDKGKNDKDNIKKIKISEICGDIF